VKKNAESAREEPWAIGIEVIKLRFCTVRSIAWISLTSCRERERERERSDRGARVIKVKVLLYLGNGRKKQNQR
jgi:hypothetical protein